MLGTYFSHVRSRKPLVHNITNYVTAGDVANCQLACGASPIMSDEPAEAADIAALCDGVAMNLGTLHQRAIESMFLAGKTAAELGHVILLDPVGAGASTLRTNTAKELLDAVPFWAIRGNYSEIKTLALGFGTTRGVDADPADEVSEETLADAIGLAKAFSRVSGAVVAISGAIDLVADGNKCFVIRNGHEMLSKLTGTGCMLSGLMTAFLAANPDQPLEAAAAAVSSMGLAGELARNRMQPGDGLATYKIFLLDALSNMDAYTLDLGANYEAI